MEATDIAQVASFLFAVVVVSLFLANVLITCARLLNYSAWADRVARQLADATWVLQLGT